MQAGFLSKIENFLLVRSVFDKFDKLGQGVVNLLDLIFIFNELGQHVTEKDVLQLLKETKAEVEEEKEKEKKKKVNTVTATAPKPAVGAPYVATTTQQQPTKPPQQTPEDPKKSNKIEFPLFMKMLDKYHRNLMKRDEESDLIDAFAGMGGAWNKTGAVKKSTLEDICRTFDLSIDINVLYHFYLFYTLHNSFSH